MGSSLWGLFILGLNTLLHVRVLPRGIRLSTHAYSETAPNKGHFGDSDDPHGLFQDTKYGLLTEQCISWLIWSKNMFHVTNYYNMVAGKIHFSIIRATTCDAPKRGSCEVGISIQDL